MNKSHAYSRSIEYRHAAYLKKRKKKKKKKDSKICIQYKLAILAFDGTLPSCLPLSVHTNHCAPSGKSELEIELVHNYDVFYLNIPTHVFATHLTIVICMINKSNYGIKGLTVSLITKQHHG